MSVDIGLVESPFFATEKPLNLVLSEILLQPILLIEIAEQLVLSQIEAIRQSQPVVTWLEVPSGMCCIILSLSSISQKDIALI